MPVESEVGRQNQRTNRVEHNRMTDLIARGPGLQLEGLSQWLKYGDPLRRGARLDSGRGRSRSCVVNCLDCRTVVYDEERGQLEAATYSYQRYTTDSAGLLRKRVNRLSISAGGVALSSVLFPDTYQTFRNELYFAAEHQFSGEEEDDRPCTTILLSHVNCGRVAERHPGISFEEVIRETFIAGQEIAAELDRLKRGTNVAIVADGLIGDENTPRYRACGLILSETRISRPPGDILCDVMHTVIG